MATTRARAKQPAKKKQPVWKEVEERDRKRLATRVKTRRRKARRYAVVYDIEGPRIRLGFLWFVVVMVAVAVGPLALGPLYAAAAGMAGNQASVAWRERGQRPDRFVSTLGAGAIGIGAAVSTALFGVAVLALAGAAVLAARLQPTRRPWLVDAGYTIQCALPAGLAAAGVLTAARFELGSAVALVLLVSAYETGDYIVGSGAKNSVEGPIAGWAAIAVVTFVIGVLAIPPFDATTDALVFGGLAACLCPIGQLLASAVLPAASARAPALRRLDSLLVLGPVWAWTIGLYMDGLQN